MNIGERFTALLAACTVLASSGLAMAEKSPIQSESGDAALTAESRTPDENKGDQDSQSAQDAQNTRDSALNLNPELDWIPGAAALASVDLEEPDEDKNDAEENQNIDNKNIDIENEENADNQAVLASVNLDKDKENQDIEQENEKSADGIDNNNIEIFAELASNPTPQPNIETFAELASNPTPQQTKTAENNNITREPTPAKPNEPGVTHRPDNITPTPKPTKTPENNNITPAKPNEAGVTHRPDNITPTPKPTKTPTPENYNPTREPTPAKPNEPGVTHRPDGISPTPKPSPTEKTEAREPTPAKPNEPGVTHKPDGMENADASGIVNAQRANAGSGENENNNQLENIGYAGPSDENRDDIIYDLNESARKSEEDLAKLLERVTVSAETMDSVSFGDIESKMRSQNFQILSFQATIDYLKTMDYQKLTDDMRKQLNALAEGQAAMMDLSKITGQSVSDSYAYNQLTQGYNALRSQYDNLKDGDMQRDNLTTIQQLQSLQDQIVTGGQTLYITLVGMETRKDALNRQIAAMNRVVETMELQYQQGSVSAIQLQQYRAQRSSLISGAETLNMTIRTMKMQLENMMGATPTGEIKIGGLPTVTAEQISSMNVEQDLQSAMSRAYELRAAAKTLEQQEETFENAARAVNYRETKESYKQAEAVWNAAKNTYNSTLRNYELRFRTLYEQVHDYYQVWDASRTALAAQESSYQAAELRYNQGNLSQNALLDARDALDTAKETLAGNANDLFSAYNSYRWAVQTGVLN